MSIFNVENCRDLEIGVKGHSRSFKVVTFVMEQPSQENLHTFTLPLQP